MIADEFRRVELLREQNKKAGYRQFRDNIMMRTTRLRDKCRDVLGHAAITRNALMVSATLGGRSHPCRGQSL
jgi:hypothetical protein